MLRRWTVTTWNLRGSAHPPLDRVVRIVQEAHADVFVVQEIRRGQRRRLARALGWQVVWHRKHHPYGPLAWWTTEGMAILTPHRVSESGSLSLTPRVSTWTYRHRVLVHALVERDDASAYRVIDLHLASDDPAERLRQAGLVRAVLDRAGPAPQVVAGDLNAADEAAVVDTIAGSSLLDAAPDVLTNPADAPRQRLDHVLVPADATVVAVTVPTGSAEWGEISDHLPVTVTFEQRWADGDLTSGQMRSQ